MSITALVVDDHAGFRTSARFLLEMEGFEVVGEASDGAAAVSAAELLRPEFVLLDVQLPDGQGFDVAREILRRGLRPRIVLVSSRDEADYGDSIRSSGAVGFVPKAELSGERIRALLEEGSSCT
ncbi:MAG: hypothetical protein AVDCRST_MAG34-98 [uncultured Nocardioidaceae bacterium]|uniref:Response regulatory domain-containing protein n=1 Tax=uncultured Nocardioidaceae bacterium TaxID=253824 RepID=A0A6J4LCV7_9ACTN|nr:MAG: hypothetical protein AVDCRST_MAG34-98 [uncultured Nocardioidaceae bacterium]